MTSVVHEDLSSVLSRIASDRPMTAGMESKIEQVKWAIDELEREGVYPEVRHIRIVLGRGSQRELAQCAREVYQERSRAPAKSNQSDAQLHDALSVLSRHARRQVEDELRDRQDVIDEAFRSLDVTRAELADAIKKAEDKQRSADALKEALTVELHDGRAERTMLQTQLNTLNVDLAIATQALADTKAYAQDVQHELSDMQIVATAASERISRLTAELLTSKSANDRLETSSNDQLAKIEKLRSEMVIVGSELHAARQTIDLAQKQRADSAKIATRRENELAKVNAKLARERLLTAAGRDQLRISVQQTASAQRESRHTTRALQASEKARESIAVTLESVQSQLDELRKENRRAQTKLSRTQRSP